ncbi:MAG: leucine-rich repeat domain-containing protein, partial [Clostridia bacterium]|nr:leucine-rich repeat domain-containing protein [Clostridia bacterium]
MRKRTSIIIICLFIALLCIGLAACVGQEGETEEQFAFSLLDDGTYKLSAARQDLPAKIVIPESYQDKPVTRLDPYAFQDCTTMEEVTVPSSVRIIGLGAFKGCTSLSKIEIPFVGRAEDADMDAFFGFIFGGTQDDNSLVPASLKTVVVTGGAIIKTDAFAFCQTITSVTLPDTMTTIGMEAFMYCRDLTEVYLPKSL